MTIYLFACFFACLLFCLLARLSKYYWLEFPEKNQNIARSCSDHEYSQTVRNLVISAHFKVGSLQTQPTTNYRPI